MPELGKSIEEALQKSQERVQTRVEGAEKRRNERRERTKKFFQSVGDGVKKFRSWDRENTIKLSAAVEASPAIAGILVKAGAETVGKAGLEAMHNVRDTAVETGRKLFSFGETIVGMAETTVVKIEAGGREVINSIEEKTMEITNGVVDRFDAASEKALDLVSSGARATKEVLVKSWREVISAPNRMLYRAEAALASGALEMAMRLGEKAEDNRKKAESLRGAREQIAEALA